MPSFFNDEIENGLFTDPTDILFVPNGATALTLSATQANFGVPLIGDGSGLYNLSTGTYAVSGTYSESTGTLIINNNTGTTFSVTGFYVKPSRSYASVSLANNTARTPSSTKDMMIILTTSLQCNPGQTSEVIVQVDNNGGGTYTTIATTTNVNSLNVTLGLLQGSSTSVQPMTFIVPRTAQYRYVTSGTGTATITSHYEIEI